MKLFTIVFVLLGAVASILGQTIELGTPVNGQVLHRGKKYTAQVVQPESIASCIQVGIALAIDNCSNGACPQPSQELGDVLYAGPWKPTGHPQGGFYQNFTFRVSEFMSLGPAIFTLTHLCLLGGGPFPFLEYRNASVTIAS